MIRPAHDNEADAVRDVVLSAYQHYVTTIGRPPAPMLDDYGVRIAAGQAWVFADRDAVAGVLVLENGPDRFLLDNIAVRPDKQGLGIGRQLLNFAEAEAARCGWDAITLYTNALMVENVAIYSARGYVEYDRVSEKGFQRVYMRKHLGTRLTG